MKPAHAAIPDAVPRRASAARGFSLLEVAVVLLLVLAMAAIALPVATSWFSDAADERTLEAITLAIRDEQLEAMVARTPRAVWIAPRSGPSSPDAGPADMSSSTSPSSTTATTFAAWSLGGQALMVAPPSEVDSSSTAPSGGSGRRATLDLPRGWTLKLDRPWSGVPSGGASSPEGGESNIAAPSESGDDDSARVVVYWPGGQVDVLGVLLVHNAEGDAWEVAIDPWTGVPSWRARASIVDSVPATDDMSAPPITDAAP
jgi:prepilin-type N-terminal cleavage/methylation domain-containing protein